MQNLSQIQTLETAPHQGNRCRPTLQTIKAIRYRHWPNLSKLAPAATAANAELTAEKHAQLYHFPEPQCRLRCRKFASLWIPEKESKNRE